MASSRTTVRPARSTTTRRTATRRRYASPLRSKQAEATKAALVRAATELFTTDGWASTGMRDIAREAGVAVETVYKHFSSKRRLLDAVVDQAAVGDAQPIPVAERPEFLAVGRGRRAERIRAAASLVTAINDRTWRFAKLIREAASSDPEIAEVLRETRDRQRADVEAGLGLLLGRPPTVAERDGVWAIVSPEVFILLSVESGWTADDYERWVADTLAAVLPSR